jgi:SAM-dependent methyltransferase
MAFEALKELQATVWGLGPFELVEATISDMHDTLVERLAPARGEEVLDVGCGTGAVALRAAARGARTTGLDLAPGLVERAAQRARDRRLGIDFGVGDVEQLPFADASFDVVASSVGAIFAPDHARVAQELARVTRPGGRLGLTAWRADGAVGELFRTMSAFQPPPAEGAGSPLAWGDPDYARSLLGGAFELELHDEISVWEAPSPDAVWDLMSQAFGPLVALLANLPDRRAEIHDALVGLAARDFDGTRVRQERTYTLILGRRR